MDRPLYQRLFEVRAALVSRVPVGRVECPEAKDLQDASLVQIEDILENVWFLEVVIPESKN